MAGIAVVVYLSEKKNRDCATSFLEIYVQLYDFEEFCRQMKQNRIKSKYLRNVDFTKLLNRSLIVYPEQNGDLGSEQFLGVDGETAQNIFSAPEERDAANWTFANKKRSGAGTDSYPDAKGLYLALRTGGGVFGVVAVSYTHLVLRSS